MGRKLEIILLSAILFVGTVSFFIKINNETFNKKSTNKKTLINNLVEYEINRSELEHTLKAKSALELNDMWKLKNPIFTNKNIKELTSEESVIDNKKMIFTKNVKVVKKDGIIYKSQKAIYDIKNKKLITPENFVINRQSDIVRGKELFYDINKKITTAKDVNGTFKLKRK
jgi:lipopolysaccharide assembly outer membrane protein LptD (OstA)